MPNKVRWLYEVEPIDYWTGWSFLSEKLIKEYSFDQGNLDNKDLIQTSNDEPLDIKNWFESLNFEAFEENLDTHNYYFEAPEDEDYLSMMISTEEASIAKDLIEKYTWWEGDGEWLVSGIPTRNSNSTAPIFAVKQSNNGATFICSSVPLPWLRAYQKTRVLLQYEDGNYKHIVHDDDDDGDSYFEDDTFDRRYRYLKILEKGKEYWNKWRMRNMHVTPYFAKENFAKKNLSGFYLNNVNLSEANLSGANLSKASLSGANLSKADLSEANLSGANLSNAMLVNAKLVNATLTNAALFSANLGAAIFKGANMFRARLGGAHMWEVDLRDADLREADLTNANLIHSDLSNANLVGCEIYGISAWDLVLENTIQDDLNIVFLSDSEGHRITVDNIEVAQFIYSLLNAKKTRDIINTITSRVVLILGNFSPERKRVLDALRKELRGENLIPLLFDFRPLKNRDLLETIITLASIARFVIADITDPKAVREELKDIVDNLPSVPIQIILQESASIYATSEAIRRREQVLNIHHYKDIDSLILALKEKIILPANNKAKELEEKLDKLRREITQHNEQLNS